MRFCRYCTDFAPSDAPAFPLAPPLAGMLPAVNEAWAIGGASWGKPPPAAFDGNWALPAGAGGGAACCNGCRPRKRRTFSFLMAKVWLAWNREEGIQYMKTPWKRGHRNIEHRTQQRRRRVGGGLSYVNFVQTFCFKHILKRIGRYHTYLHYIDGGMQPTAIPLTGPSISGCAGAAGPIAVVPYPPLSTNCSDNAPCSSARQN